MALTINSNVSATNAENQLSKKTKAVESSFEKLASGNRINKGADDAAGLAIAAALSTNVDAASVAVRNISDGVSLASVADGGLEAAGEITGRLAELATASANGTLNDSQRGSLQQEANALVSELDRISQTTQFNGQQLLSGSFSSSIQAGTDGSSSSQVGVSLPGVSSGSLNLASFDISSAAAASSALSNAKAATATVSEARGEIGSVVSRLDTAFNELKVRQENESSALSRIRDVDVAAESAKLISNKIGQKAGVAVLSQANQQPAQVLKLLQ